MFDFYLIGFSRKDGASKKKKTKEADKLSASFSSGDESPVGGKFYCHHLSYL